MALAYPDAERDPGVTPGAQTGTMFWFPVPRAGLYWYHPHGIRAEAADSLSEADSGPIVNRHLMAPASHAQQSLPRQYRVGVTVREACEVMCRLDVGAVMVKAGPDLVGVLSERDDAPAQRSLPVRTGLQAGLDVFGAGRRSPR